MFYFWNICNISDSRAAILIRYISFDSILNFKLDQISSFAFWSNAYAKIRRIMILNSWFHILTSMSHTMDSHASFALNFFSALKVFVIMIRWKCENWWLIYFSHYNFPRRTYLNSILVKRFESQNMSHQFSHFQRIIITKTFNAEKKSKRMMHVSPLYDSSKLRCEIKNSKS